MSSLPRIHGYRILVKPVDPSSSRKTAGGKSLQLPDGFVNDVRYLSNIGEVVAVGPLAYKDESRFNGEVFCKEGDYVMWAKTAGHKIRFKGVDYVLLADDNVLLSVDEPGDIDPYYNLAEGF